MRSIIVSSYIRSTSAPSPYARTARRTSGEYYLVEEVDESGRATRVRCHTLRQAETHMANADVNGVDVHIHVARDAE
jgi:hypothetical protein